MIPGNAEIVKCPYCGTEKELMTLVSGNTFSAEYWPDNKRIAPMLPMVSPVQKCPKCKKTLVPTDEDFMFFTEVALSFVENYDWTTVKYPLLKAELYREAGKMKECADVLESIPYDSLQDFERTICDDIKKRVENIDNKVFKLTL